MRGLFPLLLFIKRLRGFLRSSKKKRSSSRNKRLKQKAKLDKKRLRGGSFLMLSLSLSDLIQRNLMTNNSAM